MTILQPERNCWDIAPVDRSGLIVDGRQYYAAFHRVAGRAERYLLIAGWRFNSDVRLLRGKDAAPFGGDVRFLPYLTELCEKNRSLHIYILAWNFSRIYAREWETDQETRFRVNGQIHFKYDCRHPVAGSHHQKFVVVDGRLAFVGGLDFNADDWDDRRHQADHPDRHDSGNGRHDPYHDVQACLEGPAVQILTRYFNERWQRACGASLTLPPPRKSEPMGLPCTIALEADCVGLSLSEPRLFEHPVPSLQVKHLHEDAISAAEHLIYIESQYFSSWAVHDALVARMRRGPGLEIVIVIPKKHHSFLEMVAMAGLRIHMIQDLRRVAQETGNRIGVYYLASESDDGTDQPIIVHSKLLIVDNSLMTVGSANISNRSMGLDTELNVTWEARSDATRASIRRARVSLLAEHCGLLGSPPWPALQRCRDLVPLLDRTASKRQGRLRVLSDEDLLEGRPWLRHLSRLGVHLDLGRPLSDYLLPGQLLARWSAQRRSRPQLISARGLRPPVRQAEDAR